MITPTLPPEDLFSLFQLVTGQEYTMKVAATAILLICTISFVWEMPTLRTYGRQLYQQDASIVVLRGSSSSASSHQEQPAASTNSDAVQEQIDSISKRLVAVQEQLSSIARDSSEQKQKLDSVSNAPSALEKKLESIVNALEEKYEQYQPSANVTKPSQSVLSCCLPENKRCDWGKDPDTIPTCEKENLLTLFRWLKETLVGIDWMITAGTALGAARNSSHIPHETDIDISIDKEQLLNATEKIRARVDATHFQFKVSNSGALLGRLFYSKTNKVHVDLWIYERIPEFTIQEITLRNKQHRIRVENDILFPFSTCEYEGETYPCPNKLEKWLEGYYGKDWRVPKCKYCPKPPYRDGDDSTFENLGRYIGDYVPAKVEKVEVSDNATESSTSVLACCLPENKRCEWGKDPGTIPTCEKENLLTLFRWLKETLVGIDWVVTAGTALGAARNSSHIPHETDIDISIDKEQFLNATEKIKARVDETHFKFKVSNAGALLGRLFYSKTNSVHVDLWFYERTPEFAIQELTLRNKRHRIRVDNDILFPFSSCEYEGETYPCPNKLEKWVEGYYGKNWRVPKCKYCPKPPYRDGDDATFENLGRWTGEYVPAEVQKKELIAAVAESSAKVLTCCLPENVRCDWEKVAGTMPICEKENLLTLLRWLKETLDGIDWVITAGTALGAARNSSHIPHETDIDISIDKKHFRNATKKIKARVKSTHFKFRVANSGALLGRLFYSKTNEVHADLWFYERTPEFAIQEITLKNKQHRIRVDNDILFPFSACQYEGETYPCPNKLEKWVEGYYGKEWRIPKCKYCPDPPYRDGDDSTFENLGRWIGDYEAAKS